MTNWMPDPAALARPAYLSLAEQFARAIERGALPAGARLVPHRKLADALGLSVQTVSRAYDELIRRGLITGEVGRGSFVLGPGAEARQPYLPERPGEVIDLSILKPVVEAMHLDRLREGFLWLGENLAASSAMSFRPNMVMPQHQATGADWLMRQGIPAEPQGIIVTNGATPAITAMLRANYYGSVVFKPDDAMNDEVFGAKVLFDVLFGYQFSKNVMLSVGADNLFNTFPDRQTKAANISDGRFVYSRNVSQFGQNGGFYYGKLELTFF